MQPVMKKFPVIRYGFRAIIPKCGSNAGKGKDQKEADEQIASALSEVRKILASRSWAMTMKPCPGGGRLLLERGLTLSTAESCTGGMIGELLTEIRAVPILPGRLRGLFNALKIETLAWTPKPSPARRGQPDLRLGNGGRRAPEVQIDLAISVTGIADPKAAARKNRSARSISVWPRLKTLTIYRKFLDRTARASASPPRILPGFCQTLVARGVVAAHEIKA